jgi:folylpolyglutamate synthase/dihydropteroate synthase
MGGKWDATRLGNSEIAGLTNVGSDHRRWLGERIEERCADKGAALAAARFAVLGPEVQANIVTYLGAPDAVRAADLIQAELSSRGRIHLSWDTSELRIDAPIPGEHQVANLQLALALGRCAVSAGWLERLEPESVRQGLAGLQWQGRLSTHRVGGRRILVDCAHNLEGAEALASHLSGRPALYHLLFSCLDDKPVEAMANALRPHVGNVVVCPLQDERAMPLERLKAAFPEADAAPSVSEALELLPSPVVAAGSVRLAGLVLEESEGVAT